MEIRIRLKSCGAVYPCIPAFVNINLDGCVIVNEAGRDVVRKMKDYDVFIKPDQKWTDLTYAFNEGFLDSAQLKNWP